MPVLTDEQYSHMQPKLMTQDDSSEASVRSNIDKPELNMDAIRFVERVVSNATEPNKKELDISKNQS